MLPKVTTTPIERVQFQFHRNPSIRSILEQDAISARRRHNHVQPQMNLASNNSISSASLIGLSREVRFEILRELLTPKIQVNRVEAYRQQLYQFTHRLTSPRSDLDERFSYRCLVQGSAAALNTTWLSLLTRGIFSGPPPRNPPDYSILSVNKQLNEEGRTVLHETPWVALNSRFRPPETICGMRENPLTQAGIMDIVMTIDLEDHFCPPPFRCNHRSLTFFIHFDDLEFLHPIIFQRKMADHEIGQAFIKVWYGDRIFGRREDDVLTRAYLEHIHPFLNDMILSVRKTYAQITRPRTESSLIRDALEESAFPNSHAHVDFRPLARRLLKLSKQLECTVRDKVWNGTDEDFVKLIQSLSFGSTYTVAVRKRQLGQRAVQEVFWQRLYSAIFYMMALVCLERQLPYPGAYSRRTSTWHALQWTAIPFRAAKMYHDVRFRVLIKFIRLRAMGRLGFTRAARRSLRQVLWWLMPDDLPQNIQKSSVQRCEQDAQLLKDEYLGVNKRNRHACLRRWNEFEAYRARYYDELVERHLIPLFITKFGDPNATLLPSIQPLIQDQMI